MTACSVSLRSVRRLYAGEAALDDVTLTAPQGQVLALLGASGSGKSTILRLVAGLEPIDAGEIRLGDEIVSSPKRTLPAEARQVGMVFQDYALFPHLTIAANVAFGLDALPRAERSRIATEWLSRVGLPHRAAAYPHELSGGEQQRVALARALAPQPRAVLLDEPFSGLDPVLRGDLRDAALGAIRAAGATAIFVTHDAEEALLVADRLAIIKSGRVLQEALPRVAYDHPASPDAAAALGQINKFASRVEGGVARTPFGAIAAPQMNESDAVTVVVRAEAMSLRPGAMARVTERRPQGAFDLLKIESQSVIWRALAPARAQLGDAVDIEIQTSGAFVFSATD